MSHHPPMVRVERQATPSNHATSSHGKNRDRCSSTGWVVAPAVFSAANGARSLEMLDPIAPIAGDEKAPGEDDRTVLPRVSSYANVASALTSIRSMVASAKT